MEQQPGFHAGVWDWFESAFGTPTDIQKKAWPVIASGRHVLLTAPTGSGKTLTAFLWALHQLVSGQWEGGQTRVLYISPLKALNSDIQKNLLHPLDGIRKRLEAKGEACPDIRVLTRSGDTPQKQRRRMALHPPEILVTTPESLNLLLSSLSGLRMLTGIRTVILDEIHAVLHTRRGVHLITAVERLVRLSGEFQRIALSATVQDLTVVASFAGGFMLKRGKAAPSYLPRPVEIIRSKTRKHYRIRVRFPENPGQKADDPDGVWDVLAKTFAGHIRSNRSTLVFTNSRRLCEKLTYKINRAAQKPVAYSHHGSLSKALRRDVETRLKKGDLSAIVATGSLELGIDVGQLDEVILVQSPPSVSAAIQRLGRAGHRVGAQSVGSIYPAHVQDLVPAAVLARAVDARDLEPRTPMDAPLDVLSQVLVSMTGTETWDMDELFAWIRTSFPYRRLTREQFDLVLNMLAGRYSDTRIRELKPRISIDRLDNSVAARKGALLALYMSGGTIPDRGYFKLRHEKTGSVIGELDEEYVWEAKIGQVATMGAQNWKITRITHNDVFAGPVGNRGMEAPFWIAEGMNRDFHFSDLMGRFLEWADPRLDDAAFKEELAQTYHLDRHAAIALVNFLKRQKDHTDTCLPHRHHLVLEYVRSGPDGSPGSMLVIHTLWGGRVNRPFALALEAAWSSAFNEKPHIFPGNDAVVVQLPRPIPPAQLLALVTPANMEALIRQSLETSGFFAARFRECAGRALLVTRHKINQRLPLWMMRLKSQKLMENVLGFKDFPILLETWRTCLKDEFDLPALEQVLTQTASGAVSWSEVHTARPSPFAAGMAWNQIHQYMYQQDQPASGPSALGQDLVQQILSRSDLRPGIPEKVVRQFLSKRQRLAKGYAPASPRDLVDWVKERVAIPKTEWQALIAAVAQQNGTAAFPEMPEGPNALFKEKLAWVEQEEACFVVSLEPAESIRAAWHGNNDTADALAFLGQWLQFYGPVCETFVRDSLGLSPGFCHDLLEHLKGAGTLVSGCLVNGGPDHQVCDAQNFEILVRMARADAVPVFEPLDIRWLPLFVAHTQGLVQDTVPQDSSPGEPVGRLFDGLSQLACLPLPAPVWESEVLPARIQPYHPSFLDTLMQEGELMWLGMGKEKVAFCFEPDLAFWDRPASPEKRGGPVDTLFGTHGAALGFSELVRLSGLGPRQVSDLIWEGVWKGQLSNDTFMALRKGIETRYKVNAAGAGMQRAQQSRGRGRRYPLSRTGFSRYRGSLPLAGRFYRLPQPETRRTDSDTLDKAEWEKEKARLLLDRYGIVFREMLARERPEFSWPRVFRALVLMELSGEILSGCFFRDIPGPQFMSKPAFAYLKAGLPSDAVFWLNAVDPASLCGLGIRALGQHLPKRLPGNHMVYKGRHLMMISGSTGRHLTIRAAPDDPGLADCLAPLVHLLNRPVSAKTSVTVETVNTMPAAESPYAEAFSSCFDVVKDFNRVVLYRKRG